jgi:GntR family transcriptional regulator
LDVVVISFRVDARSGVPTYLQLCDQVRQALRMGVLTVGDRLPTVKDVVGEVAINPNTVLKAYRELEREGLIEGKPGQGTFVRGVPPGPPPATHAGLARGLRRWVRSAQAAGLADDAIRSMLQSILDSVDDAGVA